MEVNGGVVVNPSGKAENNEPLRVKYLFNKWLTQNGVRVIVNLKGFSQFGVWEMGLLTSFKKEVSQRAGGGRERTMTEGSQEGVAELRPGIFQIRGLNGSSHSYVIKGDYMNVMIDSGSDQNFPMLERGLRKIGLKVRDINLMVNSHEHCDHIGANRYFQEFAMIAAYRLAASKMIAGDYYVPMYKQDGLNEI